MCLGVAEAVYNCINFLTCRTHGTMCRIIAAVGGNIIGTENAVHLNAVNLAYRTENGAYAHQHAAVIVEALYSLTHAFARRNGGYKEQNVSVTYQLLEIVTEKYLIVYYLGSNAAYIISVAQSSCAVGKLLGKECAHHTGTFKTDDSINGNGRIYFACKLFCGFLGCSEIIFYAVHVDIAVDMGMACGKVTMNDLEFYTAVGGGCYFGFSEIHSDLPF